MGKEKSFYLIVFSLLMAVLDIIFKSYAINRLSTEGRLNFLIDFSLHKNPGIAFDIPIPLGIVVFLTLVITLFLLLYAKKHYKDSVMLSVSSLIIVVGALGNMFDRIINGFTTDYIIFFRLSAINLSDLLIVFGTLLFLYYNKDKNTN